jgi:hypothetical protein
MISLHQHVKDLVNGGKALEGHHECFIEPGIWKGRYEELRSIKQELIRTASTVHSKPLDQSS